MCPSRMVESILRLGLRSVHSLVMITVSIVILVRAISTLG